MAKCKGSSKHYPGTITKDNGNGTYCVRFDDGDKDAEVPRENIDNIDSIIDRTLTVSKEQQGEFKEGDDVEVDFKCRGHYYPGRIARGHLNGTYDIEYNDGECEQEVEAEMIKRALHGASVARRQDAEEQNDSGEQVTGGDAPISGGNSGREKGASGNVAGAEDSTDKAEQSQWWKGEAIRARAEASQRRLSATGHLRSATGEYCIGSHLKYHSHALNPLALFMQMQNKRPRMNGQQSFRRRMQL
jgi:hypothetical protein